jgi:HlyD family secretion protein
MKRIVFFLVLILAAGGGAAYYSKHLAAEPTAAFRTATLARGDLLSTISATGTVEPEEVVDVGAQVMGLIVSFGTDSRDASKPIDYGSVVEKGTVLARIDPTPYQAALEQADATLERSQADLLQLEAKREQAAQDRKRADKLHPQHAIAETDYDSAVANYKTAVANVAVGKATIRQDKAVLFTAKTNLGYTTITSPVRGVIIDRRVNIGQTVVASLNAPSLFLIAKDLRRMQVWASVNEADIGQIHSGMPVRFTVDAHPGRTFRGTVSQIRMNATMTQNVVTYTVVVTTDNSSGKLLPYLTASVQFELERRKDVLLAPNAALRWKPQPAQIDPAALKSAAATADATAAVDRGCLWIEAASGLVRPLLVTVGASDGAVTEVSGGGLKDGMPIIVGEAGGEDAQNGEAPAAGDSDKPSNPFLPKPPKGSHPPPPPM